MYFFMLSLVLSGQVDFQLLQFNFLWPMRQVCHEPGTLHITPRMIRGGKKKAHADEIWSKFVLSQREWASEQSLEK